MSGTSLLRAAARLAVIGMVATVGLLAVPGSATAATPNPVVTDPPVAGVHGYPLWDSWFDLAPLGYEEQEYFISGVATNGAVSAPYTTRIIVTRPTSAAKWNGNVLLDWTNVTAQFENAVDTVTAHEYLLRSGWATVHVSAQSAGICCTPLTPKIWDPVRYQTLNHPGDAYANSMFSQIAQAIDSPVGLDPLGSLPKDDRRLIAAGQSQSASKLDNYARTTQPTTGIIDGFLIHGGGSKSWPAPPSVPVLHLLSDAEASPAAPTQSGSNYRMWEIAGSAHSDFWIGQHQVVGQGPRFAGGPKQPASAEEDLHAVAGTYGETVHPMEATCIVAGATFPMRYATSAALFHLDRWIRDGVVPPEGQRYQFNGSTLARDTHGNAMGGIRLAPIDVPIAQYRSTDCVLGGITVPFTEVQIKQLYPTHDDYFSQMQARTAENVAGGFLLPEDAVDLLKRACAAKVRWQDVSGTGCDTEPIVPEVPLTLLLPLITAALLAVIVSRRRRAGDMGSPVAFSPHPATARATLR